MNKDRCKPPLKSKAVTGNHSFGPVRVFQTFVGWLHPSWPKIEYPAPRSKQITFVLSKTKLLQTQNKVRITVEKIK